MRHYRNICHSFIWRDRLSFRVRRASGCIKGERGRLVWHRVGGYISSRAVTMTMLGQHAWLAHHSNRSIVPTAPRPSPEGPRRAPVPSTTPARATCAQPTPVADPGLVVRVFCSAGPDPSSSTLGAVSMAKAGEFVYVSRTCAISRASLACLSTARSTSARCARAVPRADF